MSATTPTRPSATRAGALAVPGRASAQAVISIAAASARRLAAACWLPALAVAVIAVQAQVHLAIGVPGHRGLVWLGALALVAVRSGRGWTIGTASAASAIALATGTGGSAGPLNVVPYLAAAALLELVALAPALRRHPVLLVPAAAAVHLVGLIQPLAKSLAVGVQPGAFAAGMLAPIALHVAFGALAGAWAWLAGRALTADRQAGSSTSR